jgi:hypothetical protein
MQIEQHLRGCDNCEKFGGEYAALVQGLRASMVTTDPEVHGRLRRRMRDLWSNEEG